MIIKVFHDGIEFDHSSNNTISGNSITNNSDDGICLYCSDYNSISGNSISNNSDIGICIEYSDNIIISENNITSNDYGIRYAYSRSLKVFHNNFINNGVQVHPNPEYVNIWDDGYPSGGNYWSDYTGTDTNGDGIGDSPYFIDSYNKDRYPLITPIPEFPSTLILVLFMAATLTTITLWKAKRKRQFS
jgi:parallel beta-helix repeat protein